MGSNGARALVAVLAVGVAIVLFVVLSGGDDEDSSPATSTTSSTTTQASTDDQNTDKPDKPAEPEVAVVEVKGGQPVGGVQDLTFKSGETIRFDVVSDEDHEVHFHGYNVSEEVGPGNDASFDIPADIEGVFEVELEDTVTPIAEVSVEP